MIDYESQETQKTLFIGGPVMNESNPPNPVSGPSSSLPTLRLARLAKERFAANLLVSKLAPVASWFYANLEMKVLAFCVVWFLIAAPAAYGDGCFIPPTAFAKVEIPDQRALIHFDKGMETLVIDTSFKGEGTNFAWIVPVPSAPKVETTTTGLFPTLETIFQPQIIHYIPPYYWWAICVGAFLFSILRKLRRRESVAGVLIGWFCALLLAGLLLPALATAGASALATGAVKVVERKRIGIYDTAVLSSRDGVALLDWLGKNGFVTPTNVIPAIQEYAQEGWFFVASKIRLDKFLSEPAKPTPLALTFKTERPVYPLRLTGIGNETCRIDLYVFGPERAEIPDFAVERCATPHYPRTNDIGSFYWGLGQLRIRHPGLRNLVDQSPVATKLTARLNSQQMKKDAYIAWSPFEEKRLTFYSEHGAAALATNLAVAILIVALLILYWFARGEGANAPRVFRRCVMAVSVSVLFWIAIYQLVPKIPVFVQKRAALMNSQLHQNIPIALELAAEEKGSNFTPDIAWVRAQLGESSIFRSKLGQTVDFLHDTHSQGQTNFFNGQLWHEEDSPGNCTVRQTAEGIEYVWYDIDGAEYAVPLFRTNK
jgi:hypothetical protein